MAFAAFRRSVEQRAKALEECGSHFSQSSGADISVSQIEHIPTNEAFHRLTNLPFQLRLIEDEPLSLTEARMLYDSCLLDLLCSILNRMQWTQLCNRLEDPIAAGSGFAAAGCALRCIQALLQAWSRVKPPDAKVARLETFGRYYRV